MATAGFSAVEESYIPWVYREQAQKLEEQHNANHPDNPIRVEIIARYKPPCCRCGDRTFLCLLISVPTMIIIPLIVYCLHKMDVIEIEPEERFEEILVVCGVVALIVFIAFTFALLACEARSTRYEYRFVSTPLNQTLNAPLSPDNSPAPSPQSSIRRPHRQSSAKEPHPNRSSSVNKKSSSSSSSKPVTAHNHRSLAAQPDKTETTTIEMRPIEPSSKSPNDSKPPNVTQSTGTPAPTQQGGPPPVITSHL